MSRPATEPETGVRPAVRATSAYPYTPHEAPVKLDQNESARDLPPDVRARALERVAAASWNRYPHPAAGELARAIAGHEGWDPDGVVVAPGSNVLIHAAADAAGVGRRVLTVAPAFPLYALAGRVLAERLIEVPLEPGPDGPFNLPLDALRRELKAGTGVLYLAEPHAPTGTLHDRTSLERVLDASSGWLAVLDEAYHQFSGGDLLDLVRARPNALSLRTMSKAWGLGGVRVGYALASPALATELRKVLLPFNLSVLAEAVALAALESPGYVAERAAETVRERERVRAELERTTPWTVYPSRANYLLLGTPDAPGIWRGLLDRGVLVRRQDGHAGLEGCLRASVGTPEQNDAFLAAARELA